MTPERVLELLRRLLDSVSEKWWLEPYHEALREAIRLIESSRTVAGDKGGKVR